MAPARPVVRRRRRAALIVLVPFLIAALLHAYPWARLVLQPELADRADGRAERAGRGVGARAAGRAAARARPRRPVGRRRR